MKHYKAYAKVNIFLKITGTRGNYHEIISRFMIVDTLYDTLYFQPKSFQDFQIIGDFSCDVYQNTIYKAYKALLAKTQSKKLEDFMQQYSVVVEKNIPAFAGLGGGSSDAATYLKMCNEVVGLDLTTQELALVGLEVGADVPFFIYGYKSANVAGIGEIVEAFDENPLTLETYTPKVEISTPQVYTSYRKNFFAPISEQELIFLKQSTSKDLLKKYTINELNDLFAPALLEYPELQQYKKDGYFFSGSGSSFFRSL